MKLVKFTSTSLALFLGCVVAAGSQSGATHAPAQKKKSVPHKRSTTANPSHPAHKPAAKTAHQAAPKTAISTVTTPSGLKYVDLVVGKGPTPKDGDTVVVEYTGRFMNGKVFDTSVGREPFDFVLGRGNVIKGWDEGVGSMHVGGKRKLIIPPDMAYGLRGAGDQRSPHHIPPNATLVFEVKLLKIQ